MVISKNYFVASLAILMAASFFMSHRVIKTTEALQENLSTPNAPTVIVDAGHGGFDGGAVAADGTNEKGINLAIATKLGEVLQLYGFEVVMVREDDRAVYDETAKNKKTSDIRNRFKLTQDYPQAIYISVHQNKFQQKSSWGTQVFYGPKNEQSKVLAQQIQQNVVAQLQPENQRQIKKGESNIYILHHSQIPTVLVECGFISNDSDLALLKTDEYQQKMAYLIFESLLKYLKEGQ